MLDHKAKLDYYPPSVEILVIKSESIICASPGAGQTENIDDYLDI